MTQAYLYMRCSGQEQVEGDTWDRQRTAALRAAAQTGLEIVREYREEAVSGAVQGNERPALSQMLSDLTDGPVKAIVIEKLDRPARDLMVQEAIIADFRRRDLTLVSCAEPDLCSEDPSRVLMRQMMGAFAQYEKNMIVSRTRVARERIRAKLGKCEGRHRYGAHPKKPEECEIITRIIGMFESGYKWTHIANELNEMGIRPRYGKVWYPAQIGRILKRSKGTATCPAR